MENLVTLTVNSTHFYLVATGNGWLLVDAGWEMSQFRGQMKAYGISFSEIRYVLFTHTHPDHAGLIQDVREASGAKLIIHPRQLPYLDDLKAFYAKKGGHYTPIRVEKDDLVGPDRAALARIGIRGELLETPGHSVDSISLVLDSGMAFIGDLTSPALVTLENSDQVLDSWRRLITHGARTFYHSHTPPIPLAQVEALLRG